MANHIVLFEPLFPADTGNIVRTCAGTNTELHLTKPLGLSTDDKYMKWTGLDYWGKVEATYHEDLPSFMKTVPDINHLYVISRFVTHDYNDTGYTGRGDHHLLSGEETTGSPGRSIQKCPEGAIRIPQNDNNTRALNLSSSAAVVVYEILRQQSLPSLAWIHKYEFDKLK